MKEKFIRFMQGRYGVDELSKFTMGAAFVCVLLAIFAGRSNVGALLDTLGLAAIIYTYFRIFPEISRKDMRKISGFLQKQRSFACVFRKKKA